MAITGAEWLFLVDRFIYMVVDIVRRIGVLAYRRIVVISEIGFVHRGLRVVRYEGLVTLHCGMYGGGRTCPRLSGSRSERGVEETPLPDDRDDGTDDAAGLAPAGL